MTTPTAARIQGHVSSRYPWYVRLVLWAQQRKYGRPLESALLWGRLPRSFIALTLLYRSIDRSGSPIEADLRSLIQVRISQINWCSFCVDLNSATALERHSRPEKIAALADHATSPLFSKRERAALAYAEAATDPARRVDGDMFAALRSHFEENEILELTALIAFQNLSSKFNAALSVPAQGFCTAPSQNASANTQTGNRI